jgi:hypothetical protein
MTDDSCRCGYPALKFYARSAGFAVFDTKTVSLPYEMNIACFQQLNYSPNWGGEMNG